MKFEYLDHTSEAMFRSYGKTVEEAFSNAALAIFNMLLDTSTVQPILKKEISVQAKKKESLLFDFVDELIFLMDEGFLLNNVEYLEIKQVEETYQLSATLWGDNHKNYAPHGDVKAATYSQMIIDEKKDQVMIQMVVDV